MCVCVPFTAVSCAAQWRDVEPQIFLLCCAPASQPPREEARHANFQSADSGNQRVAGMEKVTGEPKYLHKPKPVRGRPFEAKPKSPDEEAVAKPVPDPRKGGRTLWADQVCRNNKDAQKWVPKKKDKRRKAAKIYKRGERSGPSGAKRPRLCELPMAEQIAHAERLAERKAERKAKREMVNLKQTPSLAWRISFEVKGDSQGCIRRPETMSLEYRVKQFRKAVLANTNVMSAALRENDVEADPRTCDALLVLHEGVDLVSVRKAFTDTFFRYKSNWAKADVKEWKVLTPEYTIIRDAMAPKKDDAKLLLEALTGGAGPSGRSSGKRKADGAAGDEPEKKVVRSSSGRMATAITADSMEAMVANRYKGSKNRKM